MRHVWESSNGSGELGMVISGAEVDRILADVGATASDEQAFYRTHPDAASLGAPIREADTETERSSLVTALRSSFALTRPEVDLVTLAVAVELNPWFRRVLGYLHDDATAPYATPWLASSLFEWPESTHLGADAALVRWHLARPVEGSTSPWSRTAPWVVDDAVTRWVHGDLTTDPALGDAVRVVPAASWAEPEPALYEAERRRAAAFVAQIGRSARVEIEIVAPEGAGKRTLAASVAAETGRDLVVADAAHLLGPAVAPALAAERIVRVTRTARILGAALHWERCDGVAPGAWDAPLTGAELTFFGSSAPCARARRPDVGRITLRLPPLERRSRISVWRSLTVAPVPEPVAEWMLTPGDIARAALVAPAGEAAVTEACRASRSEGVAHLCATLPCPYTWADLVLAPHLRRHLEELETHARLRWQVLEDWGMARLCPGGRGLTALFSGPSGTGKTMSAQVLARSLGLELLRIDLASMMSKYIGDTEKNLKLVFDACDRANVLLLFDEADALFGQRTQVKDAHDRFANVEIDYLLQRMERFEGIAVLATNRKGDIDSAFLRRLRFIVDFMQPGPVERRSLWQTALPECTPSGERLLGDMDWDLLASRLEMSGADIKGAALGAAFLARADGARIEMKHVLRAARREMQKRGVLLRGGELDA
jgi:AAA+ superfamily predicted ATPase